MIMHLYLIKLQDRTQANIVAEKLKTLKAHVPELYALEIGIDFKGDTNSYDIAECCTFLTREDFLAFGANAYHASIRQYLKSIQATTAKVDFETP